MAIERCGEFGGRTLEGRPCHNQAKDDGRCHLHIDQKVLELLPTVRSFRPEDFHPKAKEIWDRHSEGREGADLVDLEAMCIAVDHLYQAHAELKAQGTILPDPQHGDAVKLNPAWRVLREAENLYREWRKHFGDDLVPSQPQTDLERLRAM